MRGSARFVQWAFHLAAVPTVLSCVSTAFLQIGKDVSKSLATLLRNNELRILLSHMSASAKSANPKSRMRSTIVVPRVLIRF